MPIRNEVKVMKVVQANMTCSILCSSHGSAFMSIFVSISDSSVLRYVRDINNIFIEFIDECLNLSVSHTNKEGTGLGYNDTKSKGNSNASQNSFRHYVCSLIEAILKL